jgi:glycosidase
MKLIYQMLPRLWGNGRFSGIDQATLEYLHNTLGADCLWCTGVIRHATLTSDRGCTPSHPQIVKGNAGSPYAITDYYDVNPYLADNPARRMDEFRSLVERVHGAGLKLLIDFVPNHVARDNVNLGQEDDKSVHWAPGNDFFYYPGEPLRLPEAVKGEPFYENPAKASGNAFTPAPDRNDWYETIKINYCDFHTPTWDKMREIVRFWASQGVDGFRCDMVELVPWQFMQWLIASIKEEYPETLFVAEVYEKEKYQMYVEEVGFDLLYDKSGLYDILRAVTCSDASAKGITWNWQFLGPLQPHMLNFLENHDEQRLASDFFCGKAQKGYAALAVSLLLNQAPFMLYFGQEIGERGMDAEGFSGRDGRTSIFDWCTVASLERLRKWIEQPGKGLQPHEKAVLKRYQELLEMARRPEFMAGKTYDLCYCQDGVFNPDRHFAWLRSDGSKTWLLVSNFSEESQDITLRIPPEALDYLGIKAVRTVYTLTVPAWDYQMIQVN